jgi:hypothetical protein
MRMQLRCFGSGLALVFALAPFAGMAPVAEAAQIAASIEFDAAPRPAGLPGHRRPPYLTGFTSAAKRR